MAQVCSELQLEVVVLAHPIRLPVLKPCHQAKQQLYVAGSTKSSRNDLMQSHI